MAEIDHHWGTADQPHKCYILIARSGLCIVPLGNSQEQTFLHEDIDDLKDKPYMLWNGWVHTVLEDTRWVMSHLDTHTPRGILYMLHYPGHYKNPLHML